MSHRDRLHRLLNGVFHGEDRAGRAASLAASEDGMFSFLAVLALLFFAVLIGLVTNVAYVTKEKVEVQNGADAAAITAATWQARGLNAVTAANHLMGELTALCVLHYALGGPELDQDGGFPSPAEDATLNVQLEALNASATLGMDTRPDTLASYQHKAGATLYDSRLTLKYWMWWALAGQTVANVLSPIVPPLAEVIQGLCELLKQKIMQEWETLAILESGASAAVAVRRPIEEMVIPLIKQYADSVVERTPQAIDRAVKDVCKRNGVKGAVYPKAELLHLPLETERRPATGGDQPSSPPDTGESHSLVDRLMELINDAQNAINNVGSLLGPLNPTKTVLPAVVPSGPGPDGYPQNPSIAKLPRGDWGSEQNGQWVRATYPWVNAWRAPLRGAMDNGPAYLLVMSRISSYYLSWSNKYTLAKSHEVQTRSQNPVSMYVLTGTNATGVGRQSWTRREGSREADRLFCVVGLAKRKGRTIAAPAVFGQPQPGAPVAYAQAMVYNANAQNPTNAGRGGGFQPEAGWDTLNWAAPVDQSDAYAYGQGARRSGGMLDLPGFLADPTSVRHPSVHLNWQAKLVPATRRREAAQAPDLDQDFRSYLRKLADDPQLHNH